MVSEGIFSILGAMAGAGMASGREIAQFFSRCGSFSWLLIVFAAGLTGALVFSLLNVGGAQTFFPPGRAGALSRIMAGLLLTAVSGGMTAAAGELAALTVPVSFARVWGGAATLLFCAWMGKKPLRGLARLGKLLLPVMALAFLLCLRLPEKGSQPAAISAAQALSAVPRVIGYCGMNVMLSSEVICEAGAKEKAGERRRTAFGAGLTLGLLLALGNGALLLHAEGISDAALPMVALLRAYGKEGFYLAAAVLYLAVATTLLASLRGLRTLLLPFFPSRAGALAALSAAIVSLLGFEGIVAGAYPALGWLSLLLILFPAFRKRAPRIHSRHE